MESKQRLREIAEREIADAEGWASACKNIIDAACRELDGKEAEITRLRDLAESSVRDRDAENLKLRDMLMQAGERLRKLVGGTGGAGVQYERDFIDDIYEMLAAAQPDRDPGDEA